MELELRELELEIKMRKELKKLEERGRGEEAEFGQKDGERKLE
jgi:hypothetical protein